MNNEKKVQHLYTQMETYGVMSNATKLVLEYLRSALPDQADALKKIQRDRGIAIPETWELATLLVTCCEAVYERDVAHAGLRRVQEENEKLRQIKLL